MGNQLPVKCVAACNPTCCANCINPPTRDDGDGVERGNAFANASAVLSEGGQEFAANFNLEKELANEVELWRLQASSVLLTEANRRQQSPRGREGPESAEGLAAMARRLHGGMPFDHERSLSPPSRTQLSLHNRAGLTPRLSPREEIGAWPAPDPQKDHTEAVEQPPPSRGSGAQSAHGSGASGFVESTRESTLGDREPEFGEVREEPSPANIPSEKHGYEDKAVSTATAATSDGPVDVQLQARAIAEHRAFSDLSSEDSTFVGFIEDTTEAPGQEAASAPGDEALPESQSFAMSEVSGVKSDRMHF
ncbi:unnamed protein product [Effrenium voratum]|nr:unnamed protein product [Effrenium voratum]